MATTFLEGVQHWPGWSSYAAMAYTINYIINPAKTQDGKLVTGWHCTPEKAPVEMLAVQKQYEHLTGRKVDEDFGRRNGKKRKAYILEMFRQSFRPGEVTPELAHEIGCKLAEQFLGGKYQYVVATHVNTRCIHNHIVFNIVGSDMKKFRQQPYNHRKLADISDRLCREYGLTIVVPDPNRERSNGYTGPKETPLRTTMRQDIDRCLAAAESYEDFLKRMSENYEVNSSGKYLKFRNRTNGQKQFIRSHTLGPKYTEQELRKRFGEQLALEIPQKEGKKKRTPSRAAGRQKEETEYVSLSQHLRNLEAIVRADRVAIESGGDFENHRQYLRQKAADVSVTLAATREKLDEARSVLECFDAVRQYRESREPEEQELYAAAREMLIKDGIDPNGGDGPFRKTVEDLQAEYHGLEELFDSVNEEIETVDDAESVIGKVMEDHNILTERKGGISHGR